MDISNHSISADATIVTALEALNRLSGDTMTLFVVNQEGRLEGSLTDGDIRRALLYGHDLSNPVGEICKRDCLFISRGENEIEAIAKARAKRIALLPVVEHGKITSLLDLRRQRGFVPADGVLMAGGKGERLRPLTEKVPKPLLTIGNSPIIDHNVELLRQFGVENIFVTVNYLKSQIIGHFSPDAGVKCIEEPTRLGTIGSLGLIDDLHSPNIIVMNADLLTDANLEAMYLRHIDTEAWLTMGVIPYTVSVPFAIVEHRGVEVEGISEKPTYNYFANAGIYMLRREVIDFIRKGEYMDATDLIDVLIRENKRVSLFNIDGRWIDIGSPDDYRHACELMSKE